MQFQDRIEVPAGIWHTNAEFLPERDLYQRYFRDRIEVPAEIWLAIAEYLDERDLYKHFALSSTFFNLALDGRYRSVDIFKYYSHNDWLARTKAYLRHLMEPHIIHRIQHLRISGFAFDELDLESRSSRSRIAIVELAYQLVSTAPNVTSLKIKRGRYNPLGYWELVRHAWIALAPRLCSLTLLADLDELAFVVEHCFEAPRLTELEWESDGVPKEIHSSFPSTVQAVGIVQRFTDACAINLERLRLFSSNSSRSGQANHLRQLADLFRLATDIPYFSLKTSVLVHDPSPLLELVHNAKSGLKNLRLAAHEVTMEDLVLGLGLADGTRLRLEATRHLTIYLPRSPDACHPQRRSKAILETAQVYLDAMTEASSLTIDPWPLWLSDLHEFLPRISAISSVQSLKYLSLRVDAMHPGIFKALATSLPNLQSLVLGHLRYGICQDWNECSSACKECKDSARVTFCEQITNYDTLIWGLEYLEIEGRNSGVYRDPAVQQSLSVAFQLFIPSLSDVTFPHSH